MQLVLADIGIASAKQRAVAPAPELPVTGPAAATAKAPVKTEAAAPSRKWLEVEQKVMSGNSETEILEALKAVEAPDMFHELQQSVPLSNDQARQINGKYSGEITFYNGSEPWQVDWLVQADFKGGELVGKQDIKLSKNGKVFSHTGNEGSLKDFSAASGSSKAIFVKANGDTGYLQLWEANALQRLAGVYFLKESIDRFRPVGTVNLERVP